MEELAHHQAVAAVVVVVVAVELTVVRVEMEESEELEVNGILLVALAVAVAVLAIKWETMFHRRVAAMVVFMEVGVVERVPIRELMAELVPKVLL
jgi:hypothetical protein